jgi:hypothetical protein
MDGGGLDGDRGAQDLGPGAERKPGGGQPPPRQLAAGGAGAVLLLIIIIILAGDGGSEPADAATAATPRRDPAVLAPQCAAPYEVLGRDDGECCAAAAADGVEPTAACGLPQWRQLNKQPRGAVAAAVGVPVRRPRGRRCDHSAQGLAPGGVVRTGVGGETWYRFQSSWAETNWDSLPTEPVRAAAARMLEHNREPLVTGRCDADYTAWLSGWPPDREEDPPQDYDAPGSLPGDGPQFGDVLWQQEYVLCFEGELPPDDDGNVRPPPPPPPPPFRPPPPPADGRGMTSGVLYELWRDAPGGLVADLGENPLFPDHPTERRIVAVDEGMDGGGGEAYFESPTNLAEHIGTRMRAYFRAPETGCYEFALATDDDGELWLGAMDDDDDDDDDDDASADLSSSSSAWPSLVAMVPGWSPPRVWDRFPQQVASPVTLTEGQYVLLDAFAKEWEGGDNLAVAVTFPSGLFLGPIPVRDYLFLDQELLRIARLPVTPTPLPSDGDGTEMPPAAPPPPPPGEGEEEDGSDGSSSSSSRYRTCLASARVRVVRCEDFLLWQLPDVPGSCDTLPMAYCTVPSELFDSDTSSSSSSTNNNNP